MIEEITQNADFFTEEEIRQLFLDVGADKIAKRAIKILSEQISDIGLTITKIALESLIEGETLESDNIVRAAKRFSSLKLPVIHNIWIINSNGTCLFSKSYSGLKFPDTIFAGLLLGITNMCEEVSGRNLERLVLGDMAIHIRNVDSILVALVSDNIGDAVDLLVKQLGERFLEIYSHRLEETAVDINVFVPFEYAVKDIIRSWGIALPSEMTGEGIQRLLDPALLRESVIRAAQEKDLEIAMEDIRSLPLFATQQEQDLDKILAMKEQMERNPERKRGVEFIKEIFSATEELRSAMRNIDKSGDLDTDDEDEGED